MKKASDESSDPLYEIIYSAAPDDESCQVETRVPDWKAIQKDDEISNLQGMFENQDDSSRRDNKDC